MTPRLQPRDLEPFVLGAVLLGSGGGGEASLYLPRLQAALPADGVELLSLAEATTRGLRMVVAVGMIGATSVLTEKLPHGGEIGEAVAAAQRWSGQDIDALIPVEAAGLNAALAVAAAVELGLPLVDADLMGRALPRFDQLSIVVEAPELLRSAALSEPGGQVLVIDRSSPVGLERTVRAYVSHAGGWAAAAFGPVSTAVLQGRSCEGTLARALDLGRRLRSLADPSDADLVARTLGGIPLAAGRVLEIERLPTLSFTRASIAVLDRSGPLLRIEAENEYLVAVRDGEPVVTCPEILVVLDRRTGRPISVDQLRVGDDVQVVALPGPSWWREDPTRLGAVSPRAFGIDLPPVLLPSTTVESPPLLDVSAGVVKR